MKIVIDCRAIGNSGIGVYIEGVLPYLLKSQNQFLLLACKSKIKKIVMDFSNYEIAECRVKTFSLKELFCFPLKLLKKINSYDVYYSPFFNIPCGIKIPIYTTIHDVIFPDMPALTSKIGLKMRMQFYKRAYMKSDKIFTVSNFSKNRIEYYFKKLNPGLTVLVTYSAIQNYILENKNLFVKKDYILFVGNIKKHKGLQTLIEGFTLVRELGAKCKLFIVGSKESFRTKDDRVNSLLKKNDTDIVFTGAISNKELLKLYGEAALLVQPSLYEGFCLPPLEAMFCGTQALISDIPVLKEIYNDFPVTFFKSGSSMDLKEKIMELLYNKQNTDWIFSEELKQKYTFEKTAKIIIEELQKAQSLKN